MGRKLNKSKRTIKAGVHRIDIGRPDKILFPKDGLTKYDIALYYQRIAPTMLPHLKGRPLVMHHYPDGINKDNFYQKQVPDYFPKWIKHIKVVLEKGGSEHMVTINKAADLVYLADQAVVTSHIFLSRVPKLHFPDKIVFDLDPSKNDIKALRQAAKIVGDFFKKRKYAVYIMTSGIKGYHVVIPIKQTLNFNTVRELMKQVAGDLARQYPDLLTDKIVKDERKGRIFLDYLRNSYGQISVSPYSLRAVDGAPVATPIRWSELDKIAPQSFNIKNIFRRVESIKDPWEGIYKKAKVLNKNDF